MGYLLEGGPRNGEYADELPEGYVNKGVYAGVVTESNPSPTPRAVWQEARSRKPKDVDTDALADDYYENWGEGARREMFGD